MKITWKQGPPPGRGAYWIVWQASDGKRSVLVVAIEPAVIHSSSPGARLLLKLLGGLAYDYESNIQRITHHARIEMPEAP